MSVDFNIYLGIYFECERLLIKKEYNVKGCSNCQSEDYTNSKFCSECGNEIKQYRKTKVDYEDYTEEIINRFDEYIIEIYNSVIEDEKEVYIINRDTEYSHWLEEDDNSTLDLSLYRIKDIIKTFKENKKEIMNFFEKNYKNRYKIKYGIVTYYN